MVYYSRALFSGRQKIAYVFAAVCAGVLVVFNPRIVEAFLIFCLTGSIPGTDIVLSPDIVLTLMAVLVGITIALTIMRIKIRAHRIRRNQIRIPVRVVTETIIPVMDASSVEPTPLAEGTTEFPALRRKHRMRMFRKMFTQRISDVCRVAYSGIVAIGRLVGAAFRNSALVTYRIIKGLIVMLSTVVVAAIYSVSVAMRFVFRTLRNFWRMTKPYARKLDTWLELMVRKFETRGKNKLKQYETIRAFSAMSREYRKSIGELHPRVVLATSKTKATELKNRLNTGSIDQ